MGLDWDKLNQQKARLDDKLSKGGGGTRARFWRPQDGENRIRIMPAWSQEGNFAGQFWREIGQHWNVSDSQRGPVLCPKNTPHLTGECPICQFYDELKKDKGDVRAQETAKDIRSKTAFLLNIVDISDEEYTAKDVAEFKQARPENDVPFEVGDVKVQVYACPSTVFNQILSTIQVNGTDVTDPTEGHDVIIRKTGKGLKTRYETTIVLKSTTAPTVETLTELNLVGFEMGREDLMDLLVQGVGSEFSKLLPSGSTTVGTPSGSQDKADEGDLKSKMQAALS
jgi:hypothetical protein